MTPDEVIEMMIENLKSLNDTEKDRLMRYIHHLNRDIKRHDKDVYSDSYKLLYDMNIWELEIANKEYWEEDVLPDMQYVDNDEE